MAAGSVKITKRERKVSPDSTWIVDDHVKENVPSGSRRQYGHSIYPVSSFYNPQKHNEALKLLNWDPLYYICAEPFIPIGFFREFPISCAALLLLSQRPPIAPSKCAAAAAAAAV
mmetsp:Transcript_2197/g.3052  ORF Transcript_2197/g.3052 Transcript_2197/m.3052 type:complete len:115 (+) Transcript_2197:61-405(+)